MLATALNSVHRDSKAKMVPFAGWDMPVQYGSGPAAEVTACRSSAGLFDVSHMGEARVTGGEALAFVQYVTSNDASKLAPGKAQYSLLLNEDGGIKDDVIVYRVADEEFLIVLNAGCKDKDWDWLAQEVRSFPGATLADESNSTALIAVQGPDAVALVAKMASTDVAALRRFHFAPSTVAGLTVTVSRTGYTGEDGFELFCGWDDSVPLWTALAAAGGVPCGLAARDILRIEAAYPLYGHEIDEENGPIGAGLQWAVKTSKKDFIGRNAVIEKSQGLIKKRLAGLRVAPDGKGIPREGCEVYAADLADPVGMVTSGTLSPTVGYGIAMARLGAGWIEPGTALEMDIRGRRVPVLAAPLPFYRNGV